MTEGQYCEVIETLISKYQKFYEKIDDVDVFTFVDECPIQIRFTGRGKARVLLRSLNACPCILYFDVDYELRDFIYFVTNILDIHLYNLMSDVINSYYHRENFIGGTL